MDPSWNQTSKAWIWYQEGLEYFPQLRMPSGMDDLR